MEPASRRWQSLWWRVRRSRTPVPISCSTICSASSSRPPASPTLAPHVIRTRTPVEKDLKEALVKAPVLHQDETGMRVRKEGWWVHVCSTERLTHYAAHPSRGRAGMDAIGIAPRFRGTSVHDALVSYDGYGFTQA